MKVNKSYIGKVVVVTWEDPIGGGAREEVAKAPRGKAALAKWEEFGYIDDITDGVVRIMHSRSYGPGSSEIEEGLYTWIVEDLIVGIAVLESVKGVHDGN